MHATGMNSIDRAILNRDEAITTLRADNGRLKAEIGRLRDLCAEAAQALETDLYDVGLGLNCEQCHSTVAPHDEAYREEHKSGCLVTRLRTASTAETKE